MSVTRYDLEISEFYDCYGVEMEESPNGDYVEYDDYAKLEAERDRLREVLNCAVEWTRDRGYDDPETAPEWFLSALQEADG